MDLHGVLEKVKSLARTTGEYQLSHFRFLDHGSGDAKTEMEYVSHVDVQSEHILRAGLLKIIPEADFFGEETLQTRGTGYTWVVDPLDGTTNFLSGLDHWSISIALLYGDEILLSVIMKPCSGETFCAIRNLGAYHNNQRMKQVPRLPLGQALVGTGFPYRSPDTSEAFFSCAREVLYASRGIRRTGSAALDLCYVAAGFLQAFFEVDLMPYDAAGALLFLQETGCGFSDFSGRLYSLFSSRALVAGFPGSYEELREICSRHYGDEF
ncbi:inositol monophosphatase [Marispirochaeta sp.]|jgi:myo-inositol-1(or 4)-monophosphatase|uniref:inositol monophosphatase family protein n=1 Tax=Marispirochaeta sp. TaxID=2038653 RepID=UPI002D1E441E|nr:inositol monophosphatase [Marispirochaeta sp.]